MTVQEYREARRAVGPWSYVAPLLGITARALALRERGGQRILPEALIALRGLPPFWFKEIPPLPSADFKEMPNCPGYAVAQDGRCLSCRTKDPKREYLYKAWEVMTPSKGVKNYWVVGMVTTEGMRQFKLHQAVLWTYKSGPPFEGANGRHLDDNKDNNHIDNLEWGTSKENKADSRRNGTLRGARQGGGITWQS